MGEGRSRWRSNIAIPTGNPVTETDDTHPPPTTADNAKKDVEHKYRKRKQRGRWSQYTSHHHQVIGGGIALVLLFSLGRWGSFGRRDRLERYARAQALLQSSRESNSRHRDRRRDDNKGNEGLPHHIAAPHPSPVDPIETRFDGELEVARQADSTQAWMDLFARHRMLPQTTLVPKILEALLERSNSDMVANRRGGIRWIPPYLLPQIATDGEGGTQRETKGHHADKGIFFEVRRGKERMKWQDEYEELLEGVGDEQLPGPVVDYTDPQKYVYPPILSEPPATGGYPELKPLGDMMKVWDQDADYEGVITETLQHFNYSDPDELAMAEHFRDAQLPFKVYNVPEISQATLRWTDEYVAHNFAEQKLNAYAQESPDHFFAFYTRPKWTVGTMGLAPTRKNNWSFSQWAQHARYADAARLEPDQPHFYYQAGVERGDRHSADSSAGTNSFISQDLPSFSSSEANFLLFHPESQKGIQCRFGERGVVAATHYDAGRNMVAMISGAKRYILSPPKYVRQRIRGIVEMHYFSPASSRYPRVRQGLW